MPESRNTMGKMAGSAPGANFLTATCAATNAAQSPMGTASDATLSSTAMFVTYMA